METSLVSLRLAGLSRCLNVPQPQCSLLWSQGVQWHLPSGGWREQGKVKAEMGFKALGTGVSTWYTLGQWKLSLLCGSKLRPGRKVRRIYGQGKVFLAEGLACAKAQRRANSGTLQVRGRWSFCPGRKGPKGLESPKCPFLWWGSSNKVCLRGTGLGDGPRRFSLK